MSEKENMCVKNKRPRNTCCDNLSFLCSKAEYTKAFGYFSTNIGFPKTKMPNTSTTNTVKFRTMVVWVLQDLITDCTKDYSCSFIILFSDSIMYLKKFDFEITKKDLQTYLNAYKVDLQI